MPESVDLGTLLIASLCSRPIRFFGVALVLFWFGAPARRFLERYLNLITILLAVGVILVAMFGLVALTWVPIQLTPDVDLTQITVQTVWPGASPQEIEREIIE